VIFEVSVARSEGGKNGKPPDSYGQIWTNDFIFGVFRCFEGQAFHVLALNLLLFLFRVRAQKEIS
jgi:hypothetical protein